MEIKDIKKGDKFYEAYSGCDAYLEALEDAHEVNEDKKNGWQVKTNCIAMVIHGKVLSNESNSKVELFCCYDNHAYGPHLYVEPQYTDPKLFDDYR